MRILFSEIWHRLLPSGPRRAAGRPARPRASRAVPRRELPAGHSGPASRTGGCRGGSGPESAPCDRSGDAGMVGAVPCARKPRRVSIRGGMPENGRKTLMFSLQWLRSPRAQPREAGPARRAWPAARRLGDPHGRHRLLETGCQSSPVQSVRLASWPHHELHHASLPPQSAGGVLRLRSRVGWWMHLEWSSRRAPVLRSSFRVRPSFPARRLPPMSSPPDTPSKSGGSAQG